MAIIRPFKGIFYNQKKVDISKVSAPPYDNISEKETNKLYRQSRYNIIRLIGGKIISLPFANSMSVKERFHEWLEKGVLQEVSKPAVYIYRQKYYLSQSGEEKTRLGFVCLLKLAQQGKGIFPHEKTFSFPVKDRLNLLQECKTNFSAIFALYEDKQKEIFGIINKYLRKKPKINFCDAQKVRHTLWAIEDEGDIDFLLKKMRRKPIFIADGHHRYAAALKFHQQTKTLESGFALTYLAEMSEDNVSVLPTHRVVFLKGEKRKIFLERVGKFFEVEAISWPTQTSQKLHLSSNLEIYYQGHYYLLTPKPSFSVSSLDLLHNRLLKKEKIQYTHSRQEAIELAKKNKGAAFFIEPFKLKEIKEIISKGKTLPHKSTYFYPKLLTGMVMRRIKSK